MKGLFGSEFDVIVVVTGFFEQYTNYQAPSVLLL